MTESYFWKVTGPNLDEAYWVVAATKKEAIAETASQLPPQSQYGLEAERISGPVVIRKVR